MIVGTIIIFFVYFKRMEGGVIIPFTDVLIQKYTVGLEGLVTKMLQVIMLIPLTGMLFVLSIRRPF